MIRVSKKIQSAPPSKSKTSALLADDPETTLTVHLSKASHEAINSVSELAAHSIYISGE